MIVCAPTGWHREYFRLDPEVLTVHATRYTVESGQKTEYGKEWAGAVVRSIGHNPYLGKGEPMVGRS